MTFELLDLRMLFRAFRLEARGAHFSWERVMKQYRLFSARARQRRQLRELSDHILKDMGISQVDALREACKPFWVA